MKPFVREATEDDVLSLHTRLRAEDEAEVKAACGHSPMKALLHGLHHGKTWAVEYDDRTAAMFGVVRSGVDSKIGYVWLLGSKDIEDFPVTFLRQSKDWLATISEGYDVLTNYVDVRNAIHLNWLRWLGFEFGRVCDQYGVEGRPFVQASYFPNQVRV